MTKTRSLPLCLFFIVAIGIATPASAWAAHEFLRCVNVGAGNFETNRCIAAGGANEWAWRVVPEAAAFSLKAGVAVPPVVIYSFNVHLKCTTVAFSGEAKPAAGMVGEFKLKNCGFSEREASGLFGNPKTCVVAATIAFKLKGEMVNGTVEPGFEFGSTGGKVFTTIKANEPGSGVGCTEYTFEATGEGKGEKCVSPGITSGSVEHQLVCEQCDSEFRLGTEGALLVFAFVFELTPGKEWWRST